MKKLLLFFAAAVLVFSLAACGGSTTDEESSYTYTSVDINPAVEFVVDEDGNVVSVYLANEDAEIVAADLELVGLPLEQALELYLNAAVETDYINVNSNENIVTITSSDDDEEEEAIEDVEAILAEQGVGAAIFGGEMSEEYVEIAQQHDIGVGRARLISRAVDLSEDLTFEEALEMPHGEIMAILVEEHRDSMDEFIANRRADAEQMKEEMQTEAMAKVQEHRQNVDDGNVEMPDYDAIRANVEANISQIRANYEDRVNAIHDRINDLVPDTTSYTYTSVDINPAVEFVVDEDGIVVSVYYANEDAEIVAAGLDLVGLPLEEALGIYLNAAVETGYLDVATNDNIVTVTSSDEVDEEEAKADVEAILAEHKVGAAIFGGEMSEEYVALAEEHNIDVGRARLISRAVELSEDLTFEEALEMPHEEIMAILIEEHQASMEEFIAERRENALNKKAQMKMDAMDKVAQHRQEVEEGLVETPDYDAIREDVATRIDEVRATYEDKINEIRDRINGELPDMTSYTYTSIDINPAVEFVVDEDGIVVTVYYANEDAEIVAADLDLVGLPFEEALELYLNAAIETGYLDVETNENIVTITNQNELDEEEAKADVEAILAEQGIGAAIFGGEMSEEYVALAEEHNIDVGRARLISRAVELSEDLTFEEALEMPHEEIMAILVEAHRASMDEFIAERKANALNKKEEMKTQAMDKVAQHRQDVEDGLVETPDFDAIREYTEANLEEIRNRIEERTNDIKNNLPTDQADQTSYKEDVILAV